MEKSQLAVYDLYVEWLWFKDQIGLLIGHPIGFLGLRQLEIKIPEQFCDDELRLCVEELGSNAVTLASREGHVSLLDILIKAPVIAGISWGKETLRVKVLRIDPESGRVLYVVDTDADDALCGYQCWVFKTMPVTYISRNEGAVHNEALRGKNAGHAAGCGMVHSQGLVEACVHIG